VDHGKSTLIEALTGTHPDRLKEEREREMTIDLGFAWIELPGADGEAVEEVGIVDVPGHRDFIENMLAGIGGIDAALFVIAADEGVMPQTREHLAILDLLQIQGGVVALTKIDLMDDPDWLDLVEADVAETLQGTVMADAPIVRVSAKSGAGLAELKSALSASLSTRPPRPDLNRPRLPVDRIFTMAGFGSVVTGTLTDGKFQVGDEIEILPQKLRGRIRGLQTHKRKEQAAVPGSRTAVNISGVSLEEVQRGNVIAHPGDYKPTQRLDVHFRLLPDVSQAVRHNMEVKLFIGATESPARLRLLGVEELIPGQSGWLQLETSAAVVAARNDRYILRRPSPGETLGGGQVMDPHPKSRHKRFAKASISRLEALAQGTPGDILLQAVLALGAAPLKEALARSNLDEAAQAAALEELLHGGQIINLERTETQLKQGEDLVISQQLWEQIQAAGLRELEKYQRNYPLRAGLPKEELKSRLKNLTGGSARLFNASLRRLVASGLVSESGPLVHLPEHRIRFSPQQEKRIQTLLNRFEAAPYAPPSLKECQAEVGEDVLNALIDLGRLVQVSAEVVFRREDFESMLSQLRQLVQQHGAITVALVRDHFNTSRKYVLAFLEYLDASGVTVRDGDYRRLKAGAGS
jgi:selenocysteine-specific elongation factor